MAVAEASISTERASRYLEQLCQHLDHLAHLSPAHDGAGRPEITKPVVRTSDIAAVDFTIGVLHMQATTSELTLRVETADEADLEQLQALVAHRIATIGRRDNLQVTWQQIA